MNAAVLSSAAMNPPPLPDLSAVARPLPGSDPCGPSLRYDPIYDRIREARREDDPNLPQGVWVAAGKRADWEEVQRLCLQVLETRSKDLQVAAWLVEAVVHRCGFPGLAPGFAMLAGLCEAFWDGLHPEIEDGDPGARLAPLEWLNSAMPRVLNMLPISRSGQSPVVVFSHTDFLNAQRLSLVAARDQRAAEAARSRGEPLQPEVQASLSATPTPLHLAMYADIGRGVEALDALVATLDARVGRAAPSLGSVRDGLTVVRSLIATTLRDNGVEPEPAVAEPGREPDMGLAGEALAGMEEAHGGEFMGPIRSREEAYYWLSAAAAFLMQTEPQNPGPYLVRRAIEWADMPLHEVLLDLSRGKNDLAAVFDILGLSFSEMAHKRSA